MKRLAVFLIVGPILGACAVLFTSVMLGNKPDLTDLDEWAMGLFAGFLISAPSGVFDKALAYIARPAVRVPLIAAAGSTVIAGLLLFAGKPISHLPLAVFAICMGVCSWLARESGVRVP